MSGGLDGQTDEALMLAFSAGDSVAFDQLFERFRRPIYTFLLHHTGSRATAEDLFQDVFLRVIRSRDRYANTGSFRAWLFTIAHNATTDERRRRGATRLTNAPNSTNDFDQHPAPRDAQVDPVVSSEAGELGERIEAALHHLPVEQREVFLLRERGGLDFQAIADATGCKLATAKSRMRYALEGLRQQLAGTLAAAEVLPRE